MTTSPRWPSRRSGRSRRRCFAIAPEQLQTGDTLPSVSLHHERDLAEVRPTDLVDGRPLVLVSGSYTRPPFRRRSSDVAALYAVYGDRVSFGLVYIAEARPVDEWQMRANERTCSSPSTRSSTSEPRRRG